jgi:putative flippase GtrA
MADAGSIVFLIPSYQPTETLCSLLEQLRSASSAPIVVVDDGSGRRYADVFAQVREIAGTTLLTNAVNLGKGAALKYGMNYVLVHFPKCVGVVCADADGQHAVADILRLAGELEKDATKVVFGTRAFDTEVPLRSRFGNAVSRYVYRLLIGVKLSDTQTGLRGIPRDLMALSLEIRANRYEFETEQLVTIKSKRMRMQEVPIQTIYLAGNRGSHFRPLRDSARIYFVLLRYSVASIVTEMADLAVFATIMAASGNLLLSNAIGRLIAVWVQFMLLQSFVFRLRGDAGTLALYLGLVVVSGVISTAMQLQLARFVPFPVVAKVIAEVMVFVFNFLFLRDFVFGRSADDARD